MKSNIKNIRLKQRLDIMSSLNKYLLHQNRVLLRYITNLDKSFEEDIIKIDIHPGFVQSSFAWYRSPEDHHFWNNINNKIKEFYEKRGL